MSGPAIAVAVVAAVLTVGAHTLVKVTGAAAAGVRHGANKVVHVIGHGTKTTAKAVVNHQK